VQKKKSDREKRKQRSEQSSRQSGIKLKEREERVKLDLTFLDRGCVVLDQPQRVAKKQIY